MIEYVDHIIYRLGFICWIICIKHHQTYIFFFNIAQSYQILHRLHQPRHNIPGPGPCFRWTLRSVSCAKRLCASEKLGIGLGAYRSAGISIFSSVKHGDFAWFCSWKIGFLMVIGYDIVTMIWYGCITRYGWRIHLIHELNEHMIDGVLTMANKYVAGCHICLCPTLRKRYMVTPQWQAYRWSGLKPPNRSNQQGYTVQRPYVLFFVLSRKGSMLHWL